MSKNLSFETFKDLWEPETAKVCPAFAGRTLFTLKYRALALKTPFTQLSDSIDDAAPQWKRFPDGVEVAVVSAQPVASQPKRLVFQPHWIRTTSSVLDRYYVDLGGSFSDYLKKFSAKERYNLLSRVKKFKELSGGEIKWQKYLTVDQMKQFYDLAAKVSKRSWHEKSGGPGFAKTIPRESTLTLVKEGRARGYALFDQELPVAYIYCRDFNDEILIHTYTSYDEDYRRHAPGMVLNYLMLESLFAEGKYRYLDFSLGILSYKTFFATHSKSCVEVLYFKRTIKNSVLLTTLALLTNLSVIGGRLLDRIKLKQRLKRWFMGQHARPGQV